MTPAKTIVRSLTPRSYCANSANSGTAVYEKPWACHADCLHARADRFETNDACQRAPVQIRLLSPLSPALIPLAPETVRLFHLRDCPVGPSPRMFVMQARRRQAGLGEKIEDPLARAGSSDAHPLDYVSGTGTRAPLALGRGPLSRAGGLFNGTENYRSFPPRKLTDAFASEKQGNIVLQMDQSRRNRPFRLSATRGSRSVAGHTRLSVETHGK